MNINQLVYFREICDAGSISAAAERLFVARPSLSASMAALERELGATLLVRGKGGVVPTEAGEMLLGCVVECEGRLTACLQRINDMGKPLKARTLRLGCAGGTIAPDVISRIYEYERSCPNLLVELVNRDFPDLWRAVEDGLLDLVITVRPHDARGADSVRIARLEQVLIINRESPVARIAQERGWVDFACDLSGCTLPETEGRFASHRDVLKSLGIQCKMVGEDRGFIQQLIARDRGCVLTFPGLVERCMGQEACVLPVRGIPSEVDLDPYLVFRASPDEDVRGFANHVLACLGSSERI